jgi:hypothetical protein
MAQLGEGVDPLLQMYQGVYGAPPGFGMAPAPYSPMANMGFGGSPQSSMLMAMLATPYLSGFAGSNNFLPHMTPGQAVSDQFMMRQYQNSTLQNTYNTNKMGTQHVAHALLGMRSAVSNAAATTANKEGADSLAGVLTNPFLKPMLGAMVGPEMLESMLYGEAGDPMATAAVANKIGYHRQDPAGGAKRMGAESLEDFSRGLHAQLYEPAGNVDSMAKSARIELASGTEGRSMKQLREASRMPDTMRVLDDAQVEGRLADLDDVKLDSLYRKYKQGGTAETKTQKAAELKEFDRAVNASGVLEKDETTINAMSRRARDRNLEDSMGFSAGQSSQITDNLFQRGMLPQSIGALTAAERVKLIGSHKFDDETMTRMAEEFGHRDMMKSETQYTDGKTYAQLTGEQQREELHKKLDGPGGYRDKMKLTFAQIQDYNKNGAASGFKSAEEVEQLAGANLMSNNVDASRVSKVVKEKMGAVDAIREIFGDNGNPNAPVPALLAALDHLSQGAMSQMAPGKVENIIRQMRGTAKEMGVGFEQMAGFSAQMGAAGANLGLQRPTTLQATAAALTAVNTMRQAGAFANPQFGAMSQEEAMQATGSAMLRGQKSENAMSVGALARIYALDPKKYEGTELEAVVKAAQDPTSKGEYEVKDATGKVIKSGNVFTSLGRHGSRYAMSVAQNAGITESQFHNLRMDSLTGEYVPDAVGFMTQRADVITQIANRTLKGSLLSEATRKDKDNKLSQNTEAGEKQRYAISEKLAGLMLDSANFGTEQERVDHLRKNAKEQFKVALMANGVTDPREADRQAQFAYESYFGTGDAAEQGVRAQSLLSSVNNMAENQFGRNMVQLGQSYGEGNYGRFGDNLAEAQKRVELDKRMSIGFKSTPAGRISDYMAEIGRTGEKFNLDALAERVGNMIPVEELQRRFSPDMQAGTAAIHRERESLLFGEKDIKNASEAQLRKWGEIDKGVEIVSDAEIEEKRKTTLAGKTDEEVKALHTKYIKDSTANTRAQQEAEVQRYAQDHDVNGLTDADIAGKNAISKRDAALAAGKKMKGVLKDDTEAGNLRYKRLGLVESAVLESRTAEDAKKGMTEFVRLLTEGKDLSPEKLTELTENGMNAKTDEEKAAFEKDIKKASGGRAMTDDEKKILVGLRTAAETQPGSAGFRAENSAARTSMSGLMQKAAKDKGIASEKVNDLTIQGLKAKTDEEKEAFSKSFKETMGRDMTKEEREKVASFQDTVKKEKEAADKAGAAASGGGITDAVSSGIKAGVGGITDAVAGGLEAGKDVITKAVSDGIEAGFGGAIEKFVGAITQGLESTFKLLNDTVTEKPAQAGGEKTGDPTAPAAADAAVQAAGTQVQVAQTTKPSPPQGAPSGGQSEQEVNIVGTLDVPGFGKALLSAKGPMLVTPPNGGAAINFTHTA